MKALKFIGVLIIFSIIGWSSVSAQSDKTKNCVDYSVQSVNVQCLEGTFDIVGTICKIQWTDKKFNIADKFNKWTTKFKFRDKAVFTNVATGEKYYFSAVGNRTFIWRWPAPDTDVRTINWTWSLEDSNGNIIFNRHGTGHFTLNANGDIVVDTWNVKDLVCGGN